MVVYCVDRESDGSPVGEADSPAGILDLVERAGPGSYRSRSISCPTASPSLSRAWPRGLPRTWRGSISSTREVAVSIARGPWGRRIDAPLGNGPEFPVDDDPAPGSSWPRTHRCQSASPLSSHAKQWARPIGMKRSGPSSTPMLPGTMPRRIGPESRCGRNTSIDRLISRLPSSLDPTNGRLTGLARVHYPGLVPVLPTPGGSPGELFGDSNQDSIMRQRRAYLIVSAALACLRTGLDGPGRRRPRGQSPADPLRGSTGRRGSKSRSGRSWSRR